MNQHEVFTEYWEKELPAFREVIARIPEGSTYRPDPKARTAREIAWLIVVEHKVLVEGLELGVIEWEESPAPESIADLVAAFDRVHPSSVPRLKALATSRWEGDLPFTFQVERGVSHERVRHGVGIFVGHDSPSRTAIHVPAADGSQGAADLRPERRRRLRLVRRVK